MIKLPTSILYEATDGVPAGKVDASWGPYTTLKAAKDASETEVDEFDSVFIQRYVGLTVGILTYTVNNSEYVYSGVGNDVPPAGAEPTGIKEYWWSSSAAADLDSVTVDGVTYKWPSADSLTVKQTGGGGSVTPVKTIDNRSTDSEIPSAKAVYTFVNNFVGGIATQLEQL